MITLSHDEMRAAAAVIDTYRTLGLTSLGALAAAVTVVNTMRAPTAPSHFPTEGGDK